MIFRTRALARVGATALIAAGALAAAGAPAFADPADADLAVTVPSGKIAIGAPGKIFRVDLHNAGPGTATATTVTYDFTNLTKSMAKPMVEAFGEDCEATGETIVCAIGDGAAGETLPLPLPLERVGDSTGPAGSFTVTVATTANDPDKTNNMVEAPVEVVGSGVDLLAVAFDVYGADGKPVLPGATAPLGWFFINQGDRAANGVDFTLTLPEHVSFVDTYEPCEYSADNRVATCSWKDLILAPGELLGAEEGTLVKVAADAPGPVTLTGGMVTGKAIDVVDSSQLRMNSAPKAPEGLVVKQADKEQLAEVDEGDNSADFSVFVGAKADGGNNGGSGGGGSLPVTGVQAGVIGGVGLGVLAVGGVLFMLARRRRVVLVTPGDEKPTA